MRLELEMIPYLNNFINHKLNYRNIVNEFNTGFGIADIVATDIKLINYYPFKKIYDVIILKNISKYEFIDIKNILRYSPYSEKYLKYTLLKKYLDLGFLKKNNNRYKRIIDMPTENNTIIAVEAKLIKWKEAFLQAKQYKKYADYTYIAVKKDIIKNVKINLLKEESIGLLSVNNNENVEIISNPKKNDKIDECYRVLANSLLASNQKNTHNMSFALDAISTFSLRGRK